MLVSLFKTFGLGSDPNKVNISWLTFCRLPREVKCGKGDSSFSKIDLSYFG